MLAQAQIQNTGLDDKNTDFNTDSNTVTNTDTVGIVDSNTAD